MYSHYFSDFLNAHKDKIHMAAHSHHFWPNSAKIGHEASYENSMKHSDEKWGPIFETVIPKAQKIMTEMIHFSRPKDISFAPNTHDLIIKLISTYKKKSKMRILTTNSEFHSISRQLKILDKRDMVVIDYLNPENKTFENDLHEKLLKNTYDFIFMSHVFFNSGIILKDSMIDLITQNKKDAIFVLDAYHGFCAIPTDISKWENDLFYLAGSYKYAMSGEGMCFMTLPKNCQLEPLISGWFAAYSSLEASASKEIQYENDGYRFWGSTIDCTPFFRFNSVWEEFKKQNISYKDFHQYVKKAQALFLEGVAFKEFIVEKDISKIGHFITFDFETPSKTKIIHEKLLERSIMTDFRGTRLRFGFSPYINDNQINQVKSILNHLKL